MQFNRLRVDGRMCVYIICVCTYIFVYLYVLVNQSITSFANSTVTQVSKERNMAGC